MFELLRKLVFCLLAGSAGLAWAAPLELGAATSQPGPLSLTTYFDVLEDPDGSLTRADLDRPEVAARFKPSEVKKGALNFGLTQSVYWLRLTVRNALPEKQARLLEIASARLANVDLHVKAGGAESRFEVGYARPFAQRPYAHRFLIFPLSFPAGTDTVLLMRFESPAIEIPASLWTAEAYHPVEVVDHWVQAIYFGMAVAMLSFNLLLWIFLRERSYGFYICFVMSVVCGNAASTGVGPQLIWGDLPYWTTVSFGVMATVGSGFLAAFIQRLLHTRRNVPRMDRVLSWAVWICAVVSVANLVHYNAKLGLLVGTSFTAFYTWVAAYCAFRRIRAAYFFLAAFSALLLGVMVGALRIAGVVPTNLITSNALQFGAAMEMVLLAFALADRFNQIRAEKEAAQADALAAERRVVEALRISESELEGRVAARTAELSETIVRLQQTQADLVQADKMASLGALVAGVAHELNTPIGTAVTTSSTLEHVSKELQQNMAHGEMRRSTLTHFVETLVPMSELILRCCQRAAALIASFKQIAVDQTSEQRRTFDLLSIVEDNIATLRPSFRDEPWIIEVKVPEDIECDSYPGPLGQVIANLSQNAIAHGFRGRPQGCLRIRASADANAVEMEFEDDGRGMEAAVLNRIFEPFFTTTLGKGGSGLGLSVAYNIVTGVLGGSVQAESQPGQGARFRVRFPRVAPERAKQ